MTNNINDTNLVGYWHYRRGVNGNVWYNIAPSTKGQYNAEIIGATFTGKGLYFDGIDDFISVLGFANTLSRPTIEIGYIYEDKEGNPQQTLIDSTIFGLYAKWLSYGVSSETYRLLIKGNTSSFNSSVTLSRNSQTHLSVTKTDSTTFSTVRNKQINTYNSESQGMAIGGDLKFGGGGFKGYIQYVRIYDRTLDFTERNHNQDMGLEPALATPVTSGSTVIPNAPTGFTNSTLAPLYAHFLWNYDPTATQYILKRDGAVVYQGGNVYFEDKPLNQQTAYRYELSSINENGESIPVEMTITTPVLKMKDLPTGSKIKMGTQEFVNKTVDGTEDIIWQIASQDHWKKEDTFPIDATTLTTEKIIRFQELDVQEVPVGNTGNIQDWWATNIRTWLNSDADSGQWYAQKHPLDKSPTLENIASAPTNYYNYPYAQDKGFMRYFSSIEKSLLVPTDISTAYSTSEWKEPELWANDYFFLPGITQLTGHFNDNKDGHIFTSFNSNNISATPLAWVNHSSLTQPTTGLRFATRSNRRYETSTDSINAMLGWDSDKNKPTDARQINIGIKPICNIKNDTVMEEIFDVSGIGTGVYQINLVEAQYARRYPSVTTLKELPLNTIVKIGTNKFENKRVNGQERMFWRILSKNHWRKDSGYPNGITMISDRIIKYMAFGAIDTENGLPDGQTTWMFSTISKWLNNDGLKGSWFTPSSMSPNKPDYEHILHSRVGVSRFNQPYDQDDGFLSFFTEKEKSAILNTLPNTATNTGSSGGQRSSTKFFLPSQVEVVGNERYQGIDEGRLLNIDARISLLDALDTDLAFYNSPYFETPSKRNERKPYWWRTEESDTYQKYGVAVGATQGDASNGEPQSGVWFGNWGAIVERSALAFGVRPLCNLSGNTEVHLTEFINGVPVYEIEDSPVIESTGYEWSNDQPVLNPPVIPKDTTAPSEVSLISTTSTETTISINWTNPTEADFSHVNIYQNGYILLSNIELQETTISELVGNTPYGFTITTVDTVGNESTGTTFTVSTVHIDRTPPINVSNIEYTFTDTTATLSWRNPTENDFSHTRIYQNNSLLYNNFTGMTVKIVSLPSNMTQTFRITSVDLSGNESDGSYVNVTTSPSIAPDDVRNLNATKTHNTVTLYWDKPNNSDYSHAEIYMNDNINPSMTNITGVKATLINLVENREYTFKVISVDVDGNKSQGSIISIKTLYAPDNIAPSNITNPSTTVTHNTATLSWIIPSDSDFNHVKIYLDNTLIKDNVTSNSTIINGLSNNSEYTFRVASVDNVGNISAGLFVTVTTQDSPTGTYLTMSDLPLGAKLRVGKILAGSEEESVYWNVISKNHYKKDSGYPSNGVTLITSRNIKYTPYDTSNNWSYNGAEISRWLASSNTGFLRNFNDVEKNAILTTFAKLKRHGFNSDSSGGISVKSFLPSSAELHDTWQDAESGNLFQYFVDNPLFKYTGSQQLAFNNAQLNGTADTPQKYWLRDANPTYVSGWYYDYFVRYNTTEDSTRVGEELDLTKNYGVRPMINVNRSTRIEEVIGEIGVYQVLGSTTIPESVFLPPVETSQLEGLKKNDCQIHVLNPSDLSLESIVEDYESASMTINYNSLGDFVIIINNRIENAQKFIKEKYITFNGDGKMAGIITGVTIDLDDDGNEVRKVKGKTLGHLLSYRVIAMDNDGKFADVYNGLGEKAIKYYVRKNTNEAPVDRERRSFSKFVIADDKNIGQNIERKYYYENLLEIVQEIAQLQDLGYEIYYDDKTGNIVFDVYYGKDLSVNQIDENPVILSANIGNLEGQTYVYDEHNHKNFAYINRNDRDITETGIPRVITLPKGDEIGIGRKEIFYKIDSNERGYFVPSNILGEERLNSQTPLEMFDVKVVDNQVYKYGVDYKLGDIVTIRNEAWSVTKDLRVVSVTLDMSASKEYDISLTFGDILPSLTSKISKVVESYNPDKHKQW